jgi:hypothetical protein
MRRIRGAAASVDGGAGDFQRFIEPVEHDSGAHVCDTQGQELVDMGSQLAL